MKKYVDCTDANGDPIRIVLIPEEHYKWDKKFDRYYWICAGMLLPILQAGNSVEQKIKVFLFYLLLWIAIDVGSGIVRKLWGKARE